MSTTRENGRYRPTPSMIVALLALVVACSTGAYAATVLPKNSVISKTIKNGQVKSVDIKNRQVKTKDLRKNAVEAKQLADDAVDSAAIDDGQVTGPDIADGQVGAGELAPTLRTDLDDASTLGGLTVAQIVAATGGEYFEGAQAPGTADIEKVVPTDLATLELPKAGKYLINARIPVTCTYDGSDGAAPSNPAPQQPYFHARGQLVLDGTQIESQVASCEAEARTANLFGSTYLGTTLVDITRQINTDGPAVLTLRGLSAPSGIFAPGVVAGARINAVAQSSMIQAISVR